jgi:hypothetical protein
MAPKLKKLVFISSSVKFFDRKLRESFFVGGQTAVALQSFLLPRFPPSCFF